MANLKIFKHSYAEQLKRELRSGVGLDRLRQAVFDDFDENNLMEVPMLEDASDLIEAFPMEKLSKSMENQSKYHEDIQTAILLFERYKTLSPLQAANSDFWMTLTFKDLFPYMQTRWMKVKEEGFDKQSYLSEHWIPGTKLMRHGLANLWWAVRQSYDETHVENPYWLTEELFRYYEFRVYKFGVKPIFSYKPAVLGILQFMKESDVFTKGNKRGPRINYISQYVTRWNGVKMLTCLDRDFFKNELKAVESEIERAVDRQLIHGQVSEVDFL